MEAAILSLSPGTEALQPKEISPNVYRAELENATVLRARVVMPLSGSAAAQENAALAAAQFQNVRLEAGERLSFNQTVGLRTDESGYVQAEEPAYGQDISGIGGGVCQVSTALYRLALLGGLEVAERSAAVYPVPYCEAGQGGGGLRSGAGSGLYQQYADAAVPDGARLRHGRRTDDGASAHRPADGRSVCA